MILNHPFCKKDNCHICMVDHENLELYLKTLTGEGNVDHLDRYRNFMDKRLGRSSETRWGWAHPVVFEQENIDAYAEWRRRNE